MANKKLDVHLVEHTHWDREWYFTSDDSRTMLYYDMRFMIDHLLENEDKFTYDGQSSIVDDFLKFSPEWKDKLSKVVKAKRLLVGPFYTAVDATVTHGESISRNIEMGQKIAEDLGHSMKVGYLPDTFGHNNQMPQILLMNGINNLSFYRGIDPEKINNQLYFNFESPDGSNVLGHWQTHYTTRSFGPQVMPGQHEMKWFEDAVMAPYSKEGEFGPSVVEYEKRNFNLPIGIPIGTDQRPYSKKMPKLAKEANAKWTDYNFINSSYEDLLVDVIKGIKENNIELPTHKDEMRVAKTGRCHRTVASSRMDVKQLHFELEQILVNVLEPMSILCTLNDIDVPWSILDEAWKSLHKSSAHDSYACSNEDPVNRINKERLWKGIRIANGLNAMLTRIYCSKILDEEKDEYSKLVLFNLKPQPYKGTYRLETTVKREYDAGKFKIMDGNKEIKYSIVKRDDYGTHERDALTLILHDVELAEFSHKIMEIEYTEENNYVITQGNKISSGDLSLEVTKDELIFTNAGKVHKNLISIAMDPSVGDTFDHSPITHNDKKYVLTNYEVLENIENSNTIRLRASEMIPSGIEDWTANKVSVKQDVLIQITLLDGKFHVHVEAENKAHNARMIFMVDSLSESSDWYHDQQFGIYRRNLINEYMKNWEERDSLGYKWDEYPTNLSPLQTFASNNESSLTVFVNGTKEHELIEHEGKKVFTFTLYRAFGRFGTKKVLYRPGRASGAQCDAPDCQLFGDKLSYNFIIDFKQTSVEQQFRDAAWMHAKNFYVPKQWGLHRTMLRWNTDIEYYDNDKNNRSAEIKVPKQIKENKDLIMTALYKNQDGKILMRFLNIGKGVNIKAEGLPMSRTLADFKNEEINLPQYGLVNIKVK